MNTPLNDLGYEAEFAVVGALMVYPDRVNIPHGMTGEWFGNWIARAVFGAIQAVTRKGMVPDAVSVKSHLETDGMLDKIGGTDFLTEIMVACAVPAVFEDYCETIKLDMARRKVREVAAWLDKVSNRTDLAAGEIASRLLEAAAIASGSANSSPVMAIGEVHHEGEDVGVSTGFPALDGFMSCGGYAAGQTNIVSAYHKGGKTTYMLSSAVKQLQAGKRVLWATFADLNRKQIKRRILRNLCGWSHPPQSLELLHEYDQALGWLSSAPFDIYDASALDSGYDIETFAGWMRANHDRKGYDCVFVDYAQKLRSSNRMNKFEESDYCSETLGRLAASTELPFVIGSQITKGSAKDGSETKTKNSRAWEEDAGWVLRLEREGDIVKIEIPYSRFGPDGETSLRWNSERLRMEVAA